ncbi:MAG: GNAT family N-acetyltransferase [Candidatus Thiodiazotropha lotti]|nr:GNAT family N-acetyltransferase [Candidatus Thiodiazotropha lotti]
MDEIELGPVEASDFKALSFLVGELLEEIMQKTAHKSFHFNHEETEERASSLVSEGKYWIYVARDVATKQLVGFISLYESYALYAEGAYGTIPELYVSEGWRSQSVGQQLLQQASEFGRAKGWRRLEVTTPQLPEFERTLKFYQANGYEVSGGRKLKIDIPA